MRTTLIILIGVVLLECTVSGQHADKNDIQAFNEFIGEEKAKALNASVVSFEQFLLKNFPHLDSHKARSKEFLQTLYTDFSWTFDTESNKEIIELFEKTGLRKEIWIYNHEDYNPNYNIDGLFPSSEPDSNHNLTTVELNLDSIDEEIIPLRANMDSLAVATRQKELEEIRKNTPYLNLYGEFFYGLAKHTPKDTLIQSYILNQLREGVISPAIIASSFLTKAVDHDDPFIKRILVVQYYFDLIRWDVRSKKKD